MEKIMAPEQPQNKKRLRFEGGRIYFSAAAERKFFFTLTVIMLVLGDASGWGYCNETENKSTDGG